MYSVRILLLFLPPPEEEGVSVKGGGGDRDFLHDKNSSSLKFEIRSTTTRITSQDHRLHFR